MLYIVYFSEEQTKMDRETLKSRRRISNSSIKRVVT